MSTTFKLILLRFSPFGNGIFNITTTLFLFSRKTNTEICALWTVIPWNPSRQPLSPNQSEGSLLKCSEVFIEVAKSERRALGHDEVTLETVLHLMRRRILATLPMEAVFSNEFPLNLKCWRRFWSSREITFFLPSNKIPFLDFRETNFYWKRLPLIVSCRRL